MKSLLINLILAIFLISCSAVPLKYNKLSCDEIKQKQIAAEKEIKRLKADLYYKGETKAKIREGAILIPLCIILLPACMTGGFQGPDYSIYPLHDSVDKLKTDIHNLKKAAKQKQCPKDSDYENVSDLSHTMHFPH